MPKFNSFKPEICRYCRQDILRDCTPATRAAAGEPCPIATIANLSRIAEEVGIPCQRMIEMLEAGMTISDLAKLVLSRLPAGTPLS
jgi:hypothetical protein